MKFCENQRKMQDIYKEHLPLTGKNYLTVISSKYTYVYLKTFDQNMSVGAYLHILNHSPGFSSKSFVYFSLETQLFQFVCSAAHKSFYCTAKPRGKRPRGKPTSLGSDFEIPKRYLR